MIRTPNRARAAAAAAAIVALAASTFAAEAVGADIPISSASFQLSDVRVETSGSSGDAVRDREIVGEALRTLGLQAGSVFDRTVADGAVLHLRRLLNVRNATYRLTETQAPAGVTLLVTLRLQPEAALGGGALQGEDGFPVLYESETAYLRATFNGGSGVFADFDPWFAHPATFTRRNPLVQDPPAGAGTGSSATWTEHYVEYGLAGMAQIGDSPFYAYGQITGISIVAAGRDIFRDDTRTSTDVEKAYAGLLYVRPEGGATASLTVGRQNFTLNEGFLVSQFGSQYNAGPRPGLYLGPRTTHDMSALLQANVGPWSLKAFWINPNEFEPLETNTELVGVNLRYAVSRSFYGDVSVLHIPRSDTIFAVPSGPGAPREGITTYAAHLRWADAQVVEGLWLESEIAHQTSARTSMSAWAGYGTIGYLASEAPWSPSLSYRFSSHSGDDPSTARFERFDPLFGGGFGEWLQGITINKALNLANRTSHRIRLNVSPEPGLNLTLDWFKHRADELNNRGGNAALAQLASHDLGQELQFAVRWSISETFFFQGVASRAFPGRAIDAAVPGGDAQPWTSLQLQLYWNW